MVRTDKVMRVRILLVAFYIGMQLLSCSQTNEHQQAETESQVESADAERKQDIRAFWNTYRDAQKSRTDKNWQEAAGLYLKALAIDSTHEDSWFNLGNMYLELDETHKAMACWKHITKYNPGSARAHMQLGRLYIAPDRPEIFNLDSAKVAFERAFELNKVITGPLMLLGQVALFKGDLNTAASYFKAVANSDARSVEARFLMSYVACKTNRNDQAEIFFKEAAALSVPEEKIKGVLSEGDTKNDAVHVRPINESLFYRYYHDLANLDAESYGVELTKRCKQMDFYLDKVREQL